jgi:hypothetical protein
MKYSSNVFIAIALILFFSCKDKREKSIENDIVVTETIKNWKSLFNGENLDGWLVKINGYALNDNYNNTFRVENGTIKVSYDQYDNFTNEFGHLFYKTPFSNYKFRLEYRFVGEQAPGGQSWATKNSGIMIHSQSPESMLIKQGFPSI